MTVGKGARTSTVATRKGLRFYRWGAFRNRFLEALTERIQYEVPALIGSARIEAGWGSLETNASIEPTHQDGANLQNSYGEIS